ncbi:MAG TPA: protein kinase [Myxococcales bacterium]|nr:protein kinase [Myxococcales bacterium]
MPAVHSVPPGAGDSRAEAIYRAGMAPKELRSSQEITRPPLQMLRESLRADSPLREASISRLLSTTCFLAIPFVILLGTFQSWTLPLVISAVLLALGTYHAILLRAFRRGWYRPAVTWVNALIEISIPYVILLEIALLKAPDYAHMTPTHVVWGAVLVITALRANPALSMVAGFVAASEWMFVYVALILPKLPPDALVQLRWPHALMRAVCLIFSGAFGWMLARHYIRKTEETLAAVREQDLMGKYYLHERLGSGGMAEVYAGTYCPEGGFQKPVAIKRILPTYAQNDVFMEMFREEARLCASLIHPNVVQVYDCGRFRDTFIVAMEFVDGLPLNRLLARVDEPLPLEVVSYLGAELAYALDFIHRKLDSKGQPLNLVHRDVNPPNILLSRIGEVKLADFGVANAANRVATGRTDIFYGKLRYAAPEQIIAERAIDGRSDLFGLGLTLFEALTGRPVYGKEADVSLEQGIFPRIPRASELRKDVPRPLDDLVAELCDVEPSRRPATGAEVRRRLMAMEGAHAPHPHGQQSLARWVERCAGPSARPKAAKPNPAERLTEIPPLIAPSPKKLAAVVVAAGSGGKAKRRPKTTPAEAPARISSPPGPGRPAPAASRPPKVESPPTIPMSSSDLPPWALQSLTEEGAPPAGAGWKPLVGPHSNPGGAAKKGKDEEATETPRAQQGRRR